MIDTEERQINAFLQDPFRGTAIGSDTLRLADAIRALLAERDALKAQLAAKAPVRKLREYKGIVYDPGCAKWRDGPVHFNRAVDAVAGRHPFTDDDLSDMLALKDDPYEPVESVEDVVRGIIDGSTMCRASLAQTCSRLRAAVAAEMAQGEG